jgi:tRNA threonylcarbamoyladenosine biosynthesis protein TsaE
MSVLKLDISDLQSHQSAVVNLLEFAKNERVFLFDAQMGAGKTTFIKSIGSVLGVIDSMSSPTYSIVNEYYTDSNQKIFHFDLYRLKSAEELFEIGFEDYLNGPHYIFIEWPEFALPFLNSYMSIIINLENNKRYLSAQFIKHS